MVGRVLGAFAVATLIFLASRGSQPARAEEAGLFCNVSNTTPSIGQKVDVSCTLNTPGGQNAELTFYINFENHTDASLAAGRKTQLARTDAFGRVRITLDAGPTPGNLGLLVNFPSLRSSFTYIQVSGPPPPPPAPVMPMVLLQPAPPPDVTYDQSYYQLEEPDY